MTLILSLTEGVGGIVPVPSEPDHVQSLDGLWRFKLEQALPEYGEEVKRNWCAMQPVNNPETFEPFFENDYKEDGSWNDIPVPGNWEISGYSPATYNEPDNASGFYRKWFVIPESWKGRRVLVNFDGVQNAAEIWLNGKPVQVMEPSWGRLNYHESGWTAFQVELTPHADFGKKNLLALRVTKNTQSSDLDSGDYFLLGGIYRPVTLFSVPQSAIEDITIVTKLISLDEADVQVSVSVSGASNDSSLSVASLLGENVKPVEGKLNEKGEVVITHRVLNPRLWSAEFPNLYPLSIELKASQGKILEKVTQKIGIREVEIRDGILLVNRTPVKLTGICRHDVYPTQGAAVDRELWLKDLKLLKEANVNAIRTSHYPYGRGFYELCDEMGFYVIDEFPYCWCETDDEKRAPAFLQRARETIARDKNFACVIIWAVGNENFAGKGLNLKKAADIAREIDPARPRLVSCMRADQFDVELDDWHYTTPKDILNAALDEKRRVKWPVIYTENPNVWDVRLGADYGCLDLWAHVFIRTWDVVWKYDQIPGSFLWEWQDRAVADKCPVKLYDFFPDTGINLLKVKGIVDGWRNPRPDYYHMKMVHNPIKINEEISRRKGSGTVVLNITNHYSFTNLSEIHTTWRLVKNNITLNKGTTKIILPPRTTKSIEIDLPEADLKSADALLLEFYHPQGWHVATYQFPLNSKVEEHKISISKAIPDFLTFPLFNLVKNVTYDSAAKWREIKRFRGKLVNIKINDSENTSDLYKMPLSKVNKVKAQIILDDETKPVGNLEAAFNREDGTFSYKIAWIGEKTDIQELGWIFEMPKSFDAFSWKRNAIWSYYPETHIGRSEGTAKPDSAYVPLTRITRPDAYDFNSTKYDCIRATLLDEKGSGLRVDFSSEDPHHVRGGFGADNTHQLIVNKQCSPPRDISTNIVPDLYLELDKEKNPGIEGKFSIGSILKY